MSYPRHRAETTFDDLTVASLNELMMKSRKLFFHDVGQISIATATVELANHLHEPVGVIRYEATTGLTFTPTDERINL